MTSRDLEQRSELHYAALSGDATGVGRLLNEGADPNAVDRLGFTPLHLAAQEFAVQAAEVLIAHGAEVDRANEFGNTALFTAVFNSKGREEMVDLLRRSGADPRRANTSGQSPVGLARLIGNYDVARFFDDVV